MSEELYYIEYNFIDLKRNLKTKIPTNHNKLQVFIIALDF